MENDRNSVLLDEDTTKQVVPQLEAKAPSSTTTSSSSTSSYYLDAMGETEVNKLVRSSRPELIVLLGLNNFGKSTFAGSLYQLLRSRGHIGNYIFIDSETFIGWERRVYLRHIESEGPSTTKRTIRGENAFLHLKRQEVNTKENFEVVISDSSGEVYRDYISNNELIGRDKAIAQADKLLLFVDSTKLYNRSYRSFADDYTSLMRRLKENSKLPSHAIVYLIFNKIDLKDEKDKSRTDHEEAIKKIVQDAFGGLEIIDEYLDSKSLDNNQHLEDFLAKVLTPRNNQQEDTIIDWVNNDI